MDYPLLCLYSFDRFCLACFCVLFGVGWIAREKKLASERQPTREGKKEINPYTAHQRQKGE